MGDETVRIVALIIGIIALALAIVSLATPWYNYSGSALFGLLAGNFNCFVDGTCTNGNGNTQKVGTATNDPKLGTIYTATMALMIIGAIFTLFAVLILFWKVCKGKSPGHHHSRMCSVILASMFFVASTILFAVGVSQEQNQMFWVQNSFVANFATNSAGPSAGWYLCAVDAVLLLINIFVARV